MYILFDRLLRRILAMSLALVMAISATASVTSVSHAKSETASCSTETVSVVEGIDDNSVNRKNPAVELAKFSKSVEHLAPGSPDPDDANAECCVIFCASDAGLDHSRPAVIQVSSTRFELERKSLLHGLWPESLKRPPRVEADETWRA
jgi:hypothetical protein